MYLRVQKRKANQPLNFSVAFSGVDQPEFFEFLNKILGVRTFHPMQFQPMQFQPLPFQPLTISTLFSDQLNC